MNTRITASTVNRRYLTNLQRNFQRKNLTEQNIIAQRKFTRASQSPADAVRALKNRKAMSEVETYQKNLETAAGIYDSAESAVRQISSIIQTLQGELIAAAHGTYNVETDKQILGEKIENLANQMVQLMNTNLADRRMFGGVNNAMQAYSIRDGMVYFNGISVNTYNDPTMFPYTTTSYLDAGLGLSFLNDGYTVDPQSAIPVTFNGAAILGSGYGGATYNLELNNLTEGTEYSLRIELGKNQQDISFQPVFIDDDDNPGERVIDRAATVSAINRLLDSNFGIGVVKMLDAGTFVANTALGVDLTVSNAPGAVSKAPMSEVLSGFPQNIIQLTLDAAKSVRAGTDDLTALYADLIFKSGSFLSLSIASIGSNQAFIEFNQERLLNNMLGFQTLENQIEGADFAEETTNWKMLEAIYNASLQMATSTVPMSIFNFMR